MARPRKQPTYLIVLGEYLGCIGKDRVVRPDEDADDNLLDELQCPVADEVLIALRKSFSLTYPRNPFIDGLQAALQEIRRIGTDALKGIPEVLAELKLKPVPTIIDEDPTKKVYVFKYAFARQADLQIRVEYEGKKHRLLELIEASPADDLVRVLREIVSDTFSEMHNEEDHEQTLLRIRGRIATVLPPMNSILESIEIEPIAVPQASEDEAAVE